MILVFVLLAILIFFGKYMVYACFVNIGVVRGGTEHIFPPIL